MDTDADVRKLVELIFGKKPTIPEEMAAHSSIPTSWLNEAFSKKLTNVLDFRQYLFIDRLKDYFDNHFRSMLLSHVTYVTHVMSVCLCEKECNENIFDSFIRVCVLILYLSEESLLKVGVDFSDLNPDMFMVFYRKELKRYFRNREDFNRLVQYIRDHTYRKRSNSSIAFASQERHLENIREELVSCQSSENLSDTLSAIRDTVASLVREVFSNTSVKLFDLPSEYELIERLVEYRKREKANETERKRKVETTLTLENSHKDTSLHSDPKTDFGEREENVAWHESIIEAVISHNHSKDSGKEIANNQIHEEANGILEHLESKIKSLIEVLDNCSEE